MKAGYIRYMEIKSQRYSLKQELDYGSRMMSEVTRGRVDNENNSQSRYSNISNIVQGGGLYI